MIKMAREKERPPVPVPSLEGKTAVITGSSSGFGLACAKILPSLRLSHLILAVRSVSRGEKVAEPLRNAHPNTKIEVWELDMLSYQSVEAFSNRCAALPRLHIAILNAGLNKLDFATSPWTGHEEVLQVNYLSTTLLATLLLPILKTSSAQGSPGRLTVVGSAMGLNAKFPERDAVPLLPALDKEWKGIAASSERYSVSKTLVFILVLKLSQIVSAEDVIINTVDPGFSGTTSFGRDAQAHGGLRLAMGALHAIMGRTPEQGAWVYVDAAVTKGKETHGSFITNWDIYPYAYCFSTYPKFG